MRVGRSVVSMALVGAALGVACRDTTPLDFAPGDAGQTDGAVDPVVRAACTECLTEGPCKADYDACGEVARCQLFADCLLEIGCFSPPDLQDRIDCGAPCFERFDIAIGVDPALQAALPLNLCTLPSGPCGTACATP